jgi:protocatechuate 3,4-dioxygenase beta subunit
VPGLYPGRTRHIHVKVRPGNGPVLTTQLYFPGEPRNQSDGLFNTALLTNLRGSDGTETATFNFVVSGR